MIELLLGLSMYAGISFHAEDYGAPEVQGLDNPLGIVRLEHRLNSHTKVFCEHISSIPAVERGIGFNHCGILIPIKVRK